MREDLRAVLRARIAELPVLHRRIVVQPECLEQLLVVDLGRVIGDLDHLGVAGAPAGYLLIGRILDLAAHVAGDHRVRGQAELLERLFGAPEAAGGEGGLLQLLRVEGGRQPQQQHE
jgi:hypothetical protein